MPIVRRVLTHVGLGAATLLSGAWFLWPSDPWQFEMEPFTAFLVAIGVWFAAEIDPLFERVQPELHPHDAALIERFRQTLSADVRTFLTEHSFGASFVFARLDSVFRIEEEWNGVDFEFTDSQLKASGDNVIAAVRDFVHEILPRVNDIGHGRSSIVPDEQRISDWFTPETSKMVTMVNEKASAIVDAFAAFERIARKKGV